MAPVVAPAASAADRVTMLSVVFVENAFWHLGHVIFAMMVGFIFAERLSSAMNVLGAEHAARSMIRDKHVHSL